MKRSRPLQLAILAIFTMSLGACHFHRFGCGGPRWAGPRHYCHAPVVHCGPVIRFCR